MILTFYESSKSSPLISSVISTIIFTLYSFYSFWIQQSKILPKFMQSVSYCSSIKPTVIKKADQFICFKFGDIQYLDILNSFCRAASLDSFLKAYQSEETKLYFPYEWFDSPTKLDYNHLPPYNSFFSKLKKI